MDIRVEDCLDGNEENLFFCSYEKIVITAKDVDNDEDRAVLIAELFCRCYLAPTAEHLKHINEFLPDGEWNDFQHTFASLSSALNSDQLWCAKNNFSQMCQIAIRERLQRLSCIDGFIPVYDEGLSGMAGFIPFTLIERENFSQDSVVDKKGLAIPEWGQYVQERSSTWRLKLHFINGKKIPLTGRSLMLPVQLSIWHKEGTLEYDPLRLLASGSFNTKGQLCPVEIKDKFNEASKIFDKYYFLYTENFKNIYKTPVAHPLPLLDKVNLYEKIRDFIECKKLGEFSLSYLLSRLPQLEKKSVTNNIVIGENQLNNSKILMHFRIISNPKNIYSI